MDLTPPAKTGHAPRVAFDSTAVGALVVEDEAISDCNARFCEMLGCERADIVGKTFLAICPEIQADGAFSRERWQRRWYAARAGLPQWFPWQFRHCDGARIHALVHLSTDASTGSKIVASVHDI